MNSIQVHPRLRRSLTWTAVAAFSLLAACSGQDPAQLVSAGKAHFEKKEYRAAAIEFKNALQKDGSLNDARFLLGRTLLESGDAAGALVEFNKLESSGYSMDQLAPLIASAQFLQGDWDRVISQWAGKKLGDKRAQADLMATLGAAYGMRGKLDLAQASADASLRDDPKGLGGLLVAARVRALKGDPAGAMELAAQAEQAHPRAVKPLMYKAELMGQMPSKFDGAAIAEVYKAVLAVDPKEVGAHAGLIQLAIDRKDLDGAQKQWESLRQVQANGLATHYFAALIAYDKRDLRAAQESIQQALKIGPGHVAALQLAGRIAFEAGNYAQAVANFGKALPRASDSVPLRIQLARAQLRQGENAKALVTLQPLFGERGAATAEAYTLAGDAHVRLADRPAARQAYERALAIDPLDERARSALAAFDIDQGKTDRGVATLKDIARGSKGIQADLLIVSTLIRSRQLDQAREAIDAIEKKQPDNAMALQLRGELALVSGKVDDARRYYTQALEKAPEDFNSVAALVAMDQRAGKDEDALARLRAYQAKNPHSLRADLSIVGLQKTRLRRAPVDVLQDLEALVKKYPDSELPRVALVSNLIEGGDVKRAHAVAKEALGLFPQSPAVVEIMGVAELASGNLNQAMQSFSQLAALQPRQAAPLLRLARAHLMNKDVASAMTQLTKAVALEPGNMDAYVDLVTMLGRAGKYDQALAQAKAAQANGPADPTGWMLEGDLRISRREYANAVTAYRGGLARSRVSNSAVKLHRAMEDAGLMKDAQKLEAEWRAEHANDPVFNYYLGDRYLALGNLDTAAGLYRAVLEVVPNDSASLNNLAWILNQQGKPGALEMAEKAVALAPKAGPYQDTLASIHAKAGRIDKAIAAQRRAIELSPTWVVHRLHLAEYLIKDNQKAEARKLLQELAAMGSKFAQQDEVKRLTAQL